MDAHRSTPRSRGPEASRPGTVQAAVALVVAVVALVGTVVGGSLELLAHQTEGADARRLFAPAAARGPGSRPTVPDTLLAWTSGGLPDGFERRVSGIEGVDRVVSVVGGITWLSASYSATGERVDHPPTGFAIPIEVAGADPVAYRPFLSGPSRALLPAVAAGGAVLGQTSAQLRHLDVGGSLVIGRARLRIVGIMPDTDVGANEVFVSRDVAAGLGLHTERYLLIDPAPGASRSHIAAGIRAAVPSGEPVAIRGPGETPYFRQGDAVLPQVIMKERLGEFAARPESGGYLTLDPAWAQAHIVSREVPIIGRVTCNRVLFPQLRGALAEIQRKGLAHLIDPAQYAGCYSARFVNRDSSIGISHHAWGAAIDLNARANPLGAHPHVDPRIVAIFERWGFTWGGRWEVPDGMHFEFLRFPGSAS